MFHGKPKQKKKKNKNQKKEHPFSTYKKFSKKKKDFLPPDTHTCMCVSRGNKSYFFRKFCVRTKWMIPKVFDKISRDSEVQRKKNEKSSFHKSLQILIILK